MNRLMQKRSQSVQNLQRNGANAQWLPGQPVLLPSIADTGYM